MSFSAPVGQTYGVLASNYIGTPRPQWEEVSSGTFGSDNAVFSDPDATNNVWSHP